MDAYLTHIIILAAIYALMGMALNVSLGYTGMVNFGHVGIIGFAAYASAILSKTFHTPVFVSMAIGVLIGAGVAAVLSIPARKIKGDYYALVTLGFMFISNAVFLNWESVTRGTFGIPGIPRPDGFLTNDKFLWLALGMTVVVYILLSRLVHSPFGRALEAVRDDEEVAESLGKPVFKLRFIAMVISGAVAGLAGASLAHYIQFVGPSTFWLDMLVWVLAGLIIGGMASMPGSILGTIILYLFSEMLRFLPIPPAIVGSLRLMIFMALLILVIVYRPKGIMGRAQLEN